MCAVATMKRQYDAIDTLGHSNVMVDDVDAMIVAYDRDQRKHRSSSSSSKQRKRRRVVRFSEQDDEEYNVFVDDYTWLSKEEYAQIRNGAREDIRSVVESSSAQTLLNQTFFNDDDNDDDSEGTTTDDEIPRQVQRDAMSPKAILENLTLWTQHVDAGRGLESQINRKFGKARRKHRARAIRAVVTGQKFAHQNNNNKDDVKMGELLSVISQRHSELAKMHALLMGKADENAAVEIFSEAAVL